MTDHHGESFDPRSVLGPLPSLNHTLLASWRSTLPGEGLSILPSLAERLAVPTFGCGRTSGGRNLDVGDPDGDLRGWRSLEVGEGMV